MNTTKITSSKFWEIKCLKTTFFTIMESTFQIYIYTHLSTNNFIITIKFWYLWELFMTNFNYFCQNISCQNISFRYFHPFTESNVCHYNVKLLTIYNWLMFMTRFKFWWSLMSNICPRQDCYRVFICKILWFIENNSHLVQSFICKIHNFFIQFNRIYIISQTECTLFTHIKTMYKID